MKIRIGDILALVGAYGLLVIIIHKVGGPCLAWKTSVLCTF